MNCICERERKAEVWSPDEAEGVMVAPSMGEGLHKIQELGHVREQEGAYVMVILFFLPSEFLFGY